MRHGMHVLSHVLGLRCVASPADLYLTARQIQANHHPTRKHSRGPFIRERFAYDARPKRNEFVQCQFLDISALPSALSLI